MWVWVQLEVILIKIQSKMNGINFFVVQGQLGDQRNILKL